MENIIRLQSFNNIWAINGKKSKKVYKCDDPSQNNELISIIQNAPGCENAGLRDINEWLENDVDDILVIIMNEEVVEEEPEGIREIQHSREFQGDSPSSSVH